MRNSSIINPRIGSTSIGFILTVNGLVIVYLIAYTAGEAVGILETSFNKSGMFTTLI